MTFRDAACLAFPKCLEGTAKRARKKKVKNNADIDISSHGLAMTCKRSVTLLLFPRCEARRSVVMAATSHSERNASPPRACPRRPHPLPWRLLSLRRPTRLQALPSPRNDSGYYEPRARNSSRARLALRTTHDQPRWAFSSALTMTGLMRATRLACVEKDSFEMAQRATASGGGEGGSHGDGGEGGPRAFQVSCVHSLEKEPSGHWVRGRPWPAPRTGTVLGQVA